MLSNWKIVVLVFALFLALPGCEKEDRSTDSIVGFDTLESNNLFRAKFGTNVPLGPSKITFNGRTVTDNSTTFTWTLFSSTADPALRNLLIQLPDCAPDPLSFNPEYSTIGYSPSHPEIYGVQWNVLADTDNQNSSQYSLTFPGDVPLGEVYAVMTDGNETDIATIPGPCQGSEISGRVYMDANGDGLWNSDDESGIAQVLIELIDSEGTLHSMVTDQNGVYRFLKLEGNFTINLALDGYPEYFNSLLAEAFVATNTLTRDITVPPHSTQNNFGFDTLHQVIVGKLYNGTLLTTGKPREYWREEFLQTLLDNDQQSLYNGKTLQDLLAEIQVLFLKDPFVFTPGQELLEAYEILASDSTEMYDLLLAELLATELNHFTELGLLNQRELQLVLISWGESLLTLGQVDNPAPSGSGITQQNANQISQANRVFHLINTGGGGGVDE